MIREIYSKHAKWLPLFVVVAIFGIAVPTVFLVWLACTPLVAVQRSDLGTFVTATANPGGFFSPTYTSIQTTVGTVTVEGAVSAARGQRLSIDTLNKIGVQLCVDDHLQTCMPLASPWLGSMKPTPQATTVTDFQRVGLTPENVKRWLELGVMLLILAFLLAAVVDDFNDDGASDTVNDDHPIRPA